MKSLQLLKSLHGTNTNIFSLFLTILPQKDYFFADFFLAAAAAFALARFGGIFDFTVGVAELFLMGCAEVLLAGVAEVLLTGFAKLFLTGFAEVLLTGFSDAFLTRFAEVFSIGFPEALLTGFAEVLLIGFAEDFLTGFATSDWFASWDLTLSATVGEVFLTGFATTGLLPCLAFGGAGALYGFTFITAAASAFFFFLGLPSLLVARMMVRQVRKQ